MMAAMALAVVPARILKLIPPLLLLLLGSFGCAKVAGGEEDAAAGSGGGAAGAAAGASMAGAPGNPFGDGSTDLPPLSVCGDSTITGGETCDDGNKEAGDGCSIGCHVEDNYTCPTAGKPCAHIVICGDHRIDGDEAC